MMFRRNRVNKGAPSGLIISLAFHAAAFFVAGLFVVFTVVNKAEPEFVPPPAIERPRMKLKKPKVKVKKSSQPKPSSRIVAKVKTREMPEIQLPDLMGTGEGLLGGSGVGGGDFLDLPDIAEISRYGSTESIGNDLVGTFYDLKRSRNGGTTAASTDPHTATIAPILRDFLQKGWNPAVLDRYYKSYRKLYTTTVIIPETPSVTGPLAFGESEKIGGYAWCVLYEGVLTSCRDIRFRFWGMGDNFMAVAVDGRTVLAYWLDGMDGDGSEYFSEFANWDAPGTPMTYAYGHNGDWIDLKAGEVHRLQVIISEFDGGGSSFMLCVEEEGVDYPRNPYRGGRELPIFQTSVQSRTQVEELERVIYPGDASINKGPVFQDFEPVQMAGTAGEIEPEPVPEGTAEIQSRLRTWTLSDGRTVEAELIAQTSTMARIRTAAGRESEIPLELFSEDDRLYLKLEKVPRIRIDFTELVEMVTPPPNAGDRYSDARRPVEIKDYSFKTRVKLMDTTAYTYPLTVEYFAVGGEREGDNYILWKRESRTFTPSRENGFMLEFRSDRPIRRVSGSMEIEAGSRMRGEEYEGYLVTVTDQRGEIIAHRASKEFLFRHLDRLKALPVSRHFNDECIRVAPSRPIDADRGWADAVFERSMF